MRCRSPSIALLGSMVVTCAATGAEIASIASEMKDSKWRMIAPNPNPDMSDAKPLADCPAMNAATTRVYSALDRVHKARLIT